MKKNLAIANTTSAHVGYEAQLWPTLADFVLANASMSSQQSGEGEIQLECAERSSERLHA